MCTTRLLRFLTLLVAFAGMPHVLHAGTIMTATPAEGPGLGGGGVLSILTFAPNNDDYMDPGPLNPNQIVIQKQFGPVDVIDITFTVLNSA